jgi:hypothetical protein
MPSRLFFCFTLRPFVRAYVGTCQVTACGTQKEDIVVVTICVELMFFETPTNRAISKTLHIQADPRNACSLWHILPGGRENYTICLNYPFWTKAHRKTTPSKLINGIWMQEHAIRTNFSHVKCCRYMLYKCKISTKQTYCSQ